MTRPIRMPQITKTERERREASRKREQAIEDARYEVYLAKLNRLNKIGVKKR